MKYDLAPNCRVPFQIPLLTQRLLFRKLPSLSVAHCAHWKPCEPRPQYLVTRLRIELTPHCGCLVRGPSPPPLSHAMPSTEFQVPSSSQNPEGFLPPLCLRTRMVSSAQGWSGRSGFNSTPNCPGQLLPSAHSDLQELNTNTHGASILRKQRDHVWVRRQSVSLAVPFSKDA